MNLIVEKKNTYNSITVYFVFACQYNGEQCTYKLQAREMQNKNRKICGYSSN